MRLVPAGLHGLPLLLATAGALATGVSTAPAARPPLRAEYVDAASYLTGDADIEAWYTLVDRLRRNFDDVCGDTFCEGDYANIQSLSYRCSVEKHSGVIGRCVWVFAGSVEEIDPERGRVLVDARHWRCRSPLARPTRIQDLLAALSGPRPLHAPLPGTGRSLYDGLVDCL
ncbi:hypothetical protein [Frateuria sp. Soil773]|uniref:hypothetical protein n=1 Tax=Frateuria sp. Soil773 TaxID=1736407 RepID=UPI000AC35D9B|nr:hypothetical protein [Frateuria sp. Soil773]